METELRMGNGSNIDAKQNTDVDTIDAVEENDTQAKLQENNNLDDTNKATEENTQQTKLSNQNKDDPLIKEQADKNNMKSSRALRIRDTFMVISLVISLVAFLIALFPSLKWCSYNYEEKALSGNVKWQMYLAEESFNNFDYESAILWYKKAASKKGKYQATALNNLGWLYANGYGLNQLDADSEERMAIAASLFDNADELGLETATKNCCFLLYFNETILEQFSPSIYDKYFDNGEPKTEIYQAGHVYYYFPDKQGEENTFREDYSEYSYMGPIVKQRNGVSKLYYKYKRILFGVSPDRPGFEFCYLFKNDAPL